MGSTQKGLYSHWGNVLYIMEINKKRNWQYPKRFIYSLPLGKRFVYNGDTQTEKWAVHNGFIFSLPTNREMGSSQ